MELIKNMAQAAPVTLSDMVQYQPGRVVSKTLAKKPGVGVTLFAIDKGEGLSTHSAAGDAMANILDGTAEITIDGVSHRVSAGESILMPCGIPHALKAVTSFKMLLVVVFPEA